MSPSERDAIIEWLTEYHAEVDEHDRAFIDRLRDLPDDELSLIFDVFETGKTFAELARERTCSEDEIRRRFAKAIERLGPDTCADG